MQSCRKIIHLCDIVKLNIQIRNPPKKSSVKNSEIITTRSFSSSVQQNKIKTVYFNTPENQRCTNFTKGNEAKYEGG